MGMPRLISLFRSLNREEVKKFGQFFKSPYYNATPKMRDLYKYLKKTHPECPFEEKDKKRLFAKTFDGEAYTPRKMNNLTASLSSILQDFLLLEYMKRGTTARKEALVDVYRVRKLDKLSIQQLSGLQKNYEEQSDTTAFRYYERFKLYHELYFHPETRRISWQKGEDYNYLKTALENLKLFYAHLRLHYICEMNFRGNFATEEFELTTEELKTIEQLIPHHEVPLLEVYRLLYRIQQKPEDSAYQDLKKSIFKYISKYKPKQTNFLLTFLTNYQNGQLRSGNTSALEETLNLYKFGLKNDLYLSERGHFHVTHFINIAVLASEVGETAWLAKFIKDEASKLKPDNRGNTTNLCRAFLYFAEHNYSETIKLTNLVKHEAPAFALTCWTLEIRAYYMLKEQNEYWDNALKNFYAYLRRNDNINDSIKIGNRNFITFIRQLHKSNYEKKYTKKTLLEELNTKENIVCKRWLKKQIEQLK